MARHGLILSVHRATSPENLFNVIRDSPDNIKDRENNENIQTCKIVKQYIIYSTRVTTETKTKFAQSRLAFVRYLRMYNSSHERGQKREKKTGGPTASMTTVRLVAARTQWFDPTKGRVGVRPRRKRNQKHNL